MERPADCSTADRPRPIETLTDVLDSPGVSVLGVSHRVAQAGLGRMPMMGAAHGRPEERSVGLGPEKGALKAGSWAIFRPSGTEFGCGTDLAGPDSIRRVVG